MYAFPAHNLWGGIRAATRSESGKLAQTMIEFTNNNEKSPEEASIINYTFGPSSPDILVADVVVNTEGVVNASAFEEFQKKLVVMNDVKKRNMADMANRYLHPSNQQYVLRLLPTFRANQTR